MNNTINKMIKIFAMALVMMSAAFAFADQDAVVIFSTKGPDRYADGTPVMVGECYALVWTKNGSEFKGIDMNGNAVDAENNAVIVALPLAKARRNGAVHCPATLFQLDAEFAAAHADGTFALALLDTRVSDGNGGLVPAGSARQVNGWGLVEKSRVKVSAGAVTASANAGAATGTTTTETSAIPENEDIPQPKITSITVQDGYVFLTVKGTSPRLLYNIAAGDTPCRTTTRRAAAAAVPGHARRDHEITIVTPVTEGQRFFKVVRN